jgi:tRNA(Ile)-lysidine synthase
MDALPERFARRPLPELGGGPLLMGVSGGLDSMLLLRLLHDRLAESDTEIIVAHLNHRLRGRFATADERFVKAASQRLKKRFLAGHVEVAKLAKREKVSLEVAARRARHEFLAATAREVGARCIALAHHRDDQAELFFLRLLRGASPGGLAGMSELSPSPADPTITLWRPLLEFDRSELAAAAQELGLRWREDSSNADAAFTRNRVRRGLLPNLRRQFQPALNAVLARTMTQLRDEAAVIRDLADDWLRKRSGNEFAKLPMAVQRAVMELQLIAAGIEPGFELIEELRQHPNRAVSTSPGQTVQCNTRGILIRSQGVPRDFDPGRQECEAPRGRVERIEFGGGRLRVSRTRPPKIEALSRAHGANSNARPPKAEFFDAAKVGQRFALRHWRPGDRFQPIGMKQPVKLQDLLVNAKIPAAQRRALVVAEAANGELFWVENLRISESFKLDTTTKHALKWQWQR